jgi:hypothetical protein
MPAFMFEALSRLKARVCNVVYARSVFRPIVCWFMFFLYSVLAHRSSPDQVLVIQWLYVPVRVKFGAAQAIS